MRETVVIEGEVSLTIPSDGDASLRLASDGEAGVVVDVGTSSIHELPPGGEAGDLLAKASSGNYSVEWITPATSSEQDNTRPITAGAVYTEIGNINALLATI